jgi:hypothetical protein
LALKNTGSQFDGVVGAAKTIFIKKALDYGTAWRILRPSSLTDQLYIKAARIRSIQEKGTQRIEEDIDQDFLGLVNYSIMALIQLEKNPSEDIAMEITEIEKLYEYWADQAKNLMFDKNHDYGEAWRDMRISSMTDLILMKLLRIKQIEENEGQTLISEGLDANYLDIINYAVFALIKLEEEKELKIAEE